MWSESIERFPWFAHIFDLTIFPTDPTHQLSSKNFFMAPPRAQSRPGRPFFGVFLGFWSIWTIFSRLLTPYPVWMHEFLVFHQILNILPHFSHVPQVSISELSKYRPKKRFLLVFGLFCHFFDFFANLKNWQKETSDFLDLKLRILNKRR